METVLPYYEADRLQARKREIDQKSELCKPASLPIRVLVNVALLVVIPYCLFKAIVSD